MRERKQIDDDDIAVLELIEDPVWFGEFIRSAAEDNPDDKTWEFDNYQKKMLLDNSNYISACTGRSTGKTVVLETRLIYDVVSGKYNKASENEVLFVVQNKCLRGDTLITMSDNSTKLIKDIKVGDKVLSYNYDNYCVEDDEVVGVDTSIVKSPIKVSFSNGRYVICSDNHKWKISDGNIVKAKNLSVGDFIRGFLREPRSNFDKVILEMFLNGYTYKQISKKTNSTINKTKKHLRKFGVRTREKPINNIQRELIYGSLLGDAGAVKFSSGSRVSFSHCIKQMEYLEHKYSILKDICKSPPKYYTQNSFGKESYMGRFNTQSIRDLLCIYDDCYVSGKKTITKQWLDKLTPFSLAVWYMDDGNNRGSIATHSFTEEENNLLSSYIFNKFGVKFEVRKDRKWFQLVINKEEFDKFVNIIKPYIIPCMSYKILTVGGNMLPEVNKSLPHIRVIKVDTKKTGGTFYHIETKNNNNYFANDINTKNSQLEPVFLRLTKFFRRHPLLKYFIDKNSINFSQHEIKLLNGAMIRCRIIGSTADSNIIGLHCPCIYVDEGQVFSYAAWNSLMQVLTTWDEGFKLWVSGVPNGLREKNVLYEVDQTDKKFSKHNVSRIESPRYTKEQQTTDLKQYGGSDGDDYVHLVLGQHGSPAFSVFDRKLMKIENYPVAVSLLNNISLEAQGGKFNELLSAPEPPSNDLICLGADMGFSAEPTMLTILYQKSNVWREFARFELRRIKYPIQARIIDWLDKIYRFNMIAMDAGSSGLAVSQFIQENQPNMFKRLVMVDFQGIVITGYNEDGSEVKERVRKFTISQLQKWLQNDQIIVLSEQDDEVISELERVGFTRDMLGQPKYFVYSPQGGQKGEDHILASLLTWVYGYYYNYFSPEKPNPTRKYSELAKGGWNIVTLKKR